MCLKQKFTYHVFVNISVKRVFAIGWYFNWKKVSGKKKKKICENSLILRIFSTVFVDFFLSFQYFNKQFWNSKKNKISALERRSLKITYNPL